MVVPEDLGGGPENFDKFLFSNSFFLVFSFHFPIFIILIPSIHNFYQPVMGAVKPVYGKGGLGVI